MNSEDGHEALEKAGLEAITWKSNLGSSVPDSSLSQFSAGPEVGKNNDTNETFLSILNLVIDYAMFPPSPLEADEFRWRLEAEKVKSSNPSQTNQNDKFDAVEEDTLVPIIRIFGPITPGEGFPQSSAQGRDKEHLNSATMMQSGCVHIHGAYPYMLARPVTAGSDGSSILIKAKKCHSGDKSFLDRCFDWDDVECVKQITEDIHWKLECALRNSMSFVEGDDNHGATKSTGTRFIRQVSVVCGRGFYTYSNGSSAPFLRVEYYNPSHRWRVKIMLERGFDIPLEYHPESESPCNELEKEAETLKFRCYEAHIPYTMQFFKDYNLAGMAWINVNDVRFRSPLPTVFRCRKVTDANLHDSASGFTTYTVPDRSKWHDDIGPEYDNGPLLESSLEKYWTRKETSVDVEFDILVDNILNVRDIIKEKSSNEDELWRAVPSLREIWNEERQRMKMFLRPRDNFLSDDQMSTSPQFTLSVKKGSELSGSRAALKGVEKLYENVENSSNLKDSHQRALRDVLEKHQDILEKVDAVRAEILEKKSKTLTSKLHYTSQDDAVVALASLHHQFENSYTPLSLKSLAEVESLSQLGFNVSRPMTQVDEDEVESAFKFSRDLDMGRPIDPSNQDIDPFTLVQYDAEDYGDYLDEEEAMEEEEFERCLTMLQTQGVNYDLSHDNNETISDRTDVIDTLAHGTYLDIKENEETYDSKNGLSTILKGLEVPSSHPDYTGSLLFASSSSSDKQGGPYVQLRSKPPLRGHVLSGQEASRLYPILYNKKKSVYWFRHSWNNKEFLKSTSNLIDELRYAQPISRPPTNMMVFRWLDKLNPLHEMQDKHKSNIASLETKKHENNNLESPKTTSDLRNDDPLRTELTVTSSNIPSCDDSTYFDPLKGIGNAGGRMNVAGGGGLKAFTKQLKNLAKAELIIMAIEVHVQCRNGKAGVNDSTTIAMRPDASKDPIYAIIYVQACDPGGGEKIQILERGCVFVPSRFEMVSSQNSSDILSKIGKTMGITSKLKLETVPSEKNLLLRIAAIVRQKDPDALVSWDTQNGGLGYIIDRGDFISEHELGDKQKIDMIRLLGRMPSGDRVCNKHLHTGLMNDTLKVEIFATNRMESRQGSGLGEQWDDSVGAGVKPSSIRGRLILNGWKIVSEEVKHPNASYLPAMVSAILKRRIPSHDDLLLTKWYSNENGRMRWRVLKYRVMQAISTILLFDALDVVGRAGEAARLSGVEFSQSFPGIRGSQYKVEGVLLRALKSLNSDERGRTKGGLENDSLSLSGHKTQSQSPYKRFRGDSGILSKVDDALLGNREYFFYSPSKADCSEQEALEAQALTLEPVSGFYVDPIVVCDFTALYPSLIIAYNLCYTTCAGKLNYTTTRDEMRMKGATTGAIGPFHYDEIQTAYVLKHHMKTLSAIEGNNKEDRCYCLPSGSIFVSESVVKGVLPQVLDEILSTRAMLKKASKEYKRLMKNPPISVLRQLEARQLALKYVANVTYGYTSATFSGRSAMPLLADAIVECGRRTLRNAIKMANQLGADRQNRWFGAEVVYGDTDSIFIKLPGRSVQEAFIFGEEYCKAVTQSNPPPVQLKLEKVYLGALLQTKKKYCGMKYDSPDQKDPVFEAKGMETVRKDQCALTQNILRNALITIFRSQDIHSVKEYLCRQWGLIHSGSLPVSDFILTGRVRTQYRGKVGPVQAALARRLAEADPGRSTLNKERLPYVIVASPGRSFKLRDCVLTPGELLMHWSSFSIHSQYYATKHVNAALNRCFSLAPYKVNINDWYEKAPKPTKRIHYFPATRSGQNTMISTYFGSDTCAICNQKTKADGISKVVVCESCNENPELASYLAMRKLNLVQNESNLISRICRQCHGHAENSGTFAAEVPLQKKSVVGAKPTLQKDRFKIITPIAVCTCIDCPVTYKRHELREAEVKSLSLCHYLKLVDD